MGRTLRRFPGVLAWLVVGVIACPPTACSVPSDEFLCEDAVAKLKGCCPSAALDTIECKYIADCNSTIYPRFGEADARCIIGASCSDLRNGACVAGICN